MSKLALSFRAAQRYKTLLLSLLSNDEKLKPNKSIPLIA